MTKIVKFFGAPGSGKSTTAAHLFVLLKQQGYNVELIREYIKDWVWEGRKMFSMDQIYILGKQIRKEQICLGKVDFLISDSPIELCCFYEQQNDKPPYVTYDVVKKYCLNNIENGHKHFDFFLNRVKNYNPSGRFQNEEQSNQLAEKLKEFLNDKVPNTIYLDGDKDAANKVLELIL